MIVDLQTRADGLFCKPVFTNERQPACRDRQTPRVQCVWSAREIGEQAGPNGSR